MESKSQDNFSLVEQVRIKLREYVAAGGHQNELAAKLGISNGPLCRFINGKKIEIDAFSKLLIYFDMVKDSESCKEHKTEYIDHKVLKKHVFILRGIEEINNSAKLPSLALMKILKNILDSEMIREENKQEPSPKK